MKKKPYNKKCGREIEIGRFVVHLDEIEKQGICYPYSYVSVKEGVHILPIINENEICLLHQYRYPIDKWCYEFPGGSIEEGNTPEEAAERELLEETGYIADRLEPLGCIYPSYGYSDEKIHLFIAFCRKQKEQKLDPLESIKTILVQQDEIDSMIRNGNINFGNSVMCWIKYKMWKNNI